MFNAYILLLIADEEIKASRIIQSPSPNNMQCH